MVAEGNGMISGMTTISPWVNFNGNAEEAFNFYQSVFGGEFTKVVRFKDIASEEFPVEGADAEKLMQVTLAISESQMLIGNDVPAFMGTVSEEENRSKIHVHLDSKEETQRVFTQLSEGGAVEVPIDPSTDGPYFAMFRDKYGIEWIVECD